MHHENTRDERGWPPPEKFPVLLFCGCTLLFWLYVLTDADGYLGILDNFNLLIHEAGHLIFMPFGRTLHILGGSLMQCLVPSAFAVSFWRSRQPAGFAFSGLWLGQNLLNIARYLSDAQAMQLPLLGNGLHDWNGLLSGTFLLRYCRLLGGMVYLLGWGVMIAAAGWYASRWFFRAQGGSGHPAD